MAYDYSTGPGTMSGTGGYPDLPDPNDQKKVEDILETIGLHPAQLHVQGVMGGAVPQAGNSEAVALPGAAMAEPKPAAPLINASPAATSPASPSSPGPRIPSPLSTPVPPGMSSGTTSGMPLIRVPEEQNAIDQVTQAQKEYERKAITGSGISQIKNPVFRTLARIGDIAGSALFPSIAMNIPGTELHHDLLMNQDARRIEGGLNQEKDIAQADEQQARTEALAHPKPQLEMTDQGLVRVPQEGEAAPVTMGGAALKKPEPKEKPESVAQLYADAVQDAVGRKVNPEDDPTVQQYADAITSLQKQPEEKAADRDYQQWLKDNKLSDSSANKLKYDGILAAAKQAPQRAPQVTIINPQGQVQTVHPGDTITPGSVTPAGLSSESVNANKQSEAEKKAQQDAQKEYQLAQNLASHPSPTNDLALVMRYIGATKPDSLGKLRLNNNEVNLVYGTRSSLGDLEALASKVQSGQSLTPEQRQDMLNTMKILANGGEGGNSGTGGHVIELSGKRYRYNGSGDTADLKNYTEVK